jgi:hypothetical protein
VCLFDPSDRQYGLLVVHQIWQDLFLDVSLVFIVIHGGARGRGEVDTREQGCWSGAVDLSLFPNFVGGL